MDRDECCKWNTPGAGSNHSKNNDVYQANNKGSADG